MRTNASARSAGQKFERAIADCLARHIDDRIDIRPKNGAKDRGDIGGWRFAGLRIVAELKNWTQPTLGAWWREVETERANDDAQVGFIIHKRHGKADPLDQWVTTTVRDQITLMTGVRPGVDCAWCGKRHALTEPGCEAP